MLPLSHKIAFGLFAALALLLGARGFIRLNLRIARGRRDLESRTDRPIQRLVYALKATLLQQRVFRQRRGLGVFHSFIFYAFVFYLLVNAVDAVGGYVDLRAHLAPALVATYSGLADVLSVLAILGVLAFVVRRFFGKSRRTFDFNEKTLLHEKVRDGYMKRDSLLVSCFILLHVGSRIVGNAAKLTTEGPHPFEPFSSALSPLFAGPHVMAWRLFGYWGALGSVLAFLAYFPYSKHLHLLAAPVNYFLQRDEPTGVLPPTELDLEAADPQIGAAYLSDLAPARLLDAYACVQCNRCQDVCPGSQTGKALSPSALEINKRMVLNGLTEELSAFSPRGNTAFEEGRSRGPLLLEAVISAEAVWACTTCGACMEVCPTQDEQMLDIIDIRRNLVMQKGEFPQQLQNAFRGMERAGNPWAISQEKRMDWADNLQVPTLDTKPDPDVLYWVGCAASYDSSAQKTARAVVQLLAEAGINYAVLGKRECCTGDSARRAGNELLYQQLATQAISLLNEVKPKLVIASCPHCVNNIAAEYPQLNGKFTVLHHTEYLASLVDQGLLEPLASEESITFHDPCYLGRHRGTYDAPRSLLKVLTNHYVDLDRTRSNSFCCGAGGGQFWKEEESGRERVSDNRFREVQEKLSSAPGAKTLAVGCPFCKSMLQSTPAAVQDESIAVRDVAELLWTGIQRAKGLDVSPVPLQRGDTDNLRLEEVELAPELLGARSQPQLIDFAEDEKNRAPAASIGKHLDEPSRASAAVVSPAAPAVPQRKKWKPHTSAPQVEANLPAVATDSRNTGESASPEQLSATDKPLDTVEPEQKTSSELVNSAENNLPQRKKWQPKGSR